MHPGIPIAFVFIGCCSNVVFLEFIISEFPGAGNIVTFSQFLFIAIEGFVLTAKFGTVKSSLPMKQYVVMVSMFFVVQVINNMAFMFDIPMTIHIIFRAGSLIASLVLGVLILKRRYPIHKYVSVIIITLGICVCTVASTGEKGSSSTTDNKSLDLFNWLLGVSMLCFSLFMTARMGIYQEQVYAKFGKHPRESLFYNHALPLPGFLLVASSIYQQGVNFNASEPALVPMLGFAVPKMWLFLSGNVITQYICIRSVFILTTECTALTVTLVVTLRKFLSLLVSIVYFQNPFTLVHWLGAACVFGGTLVFTEVLPIGTRVHKKKE